MTKEVQAYVQMWTKKKNELEREIASKKRSLELALEKLSDPEFHLNKELKRGAVKVSKVLGLEPVKKTKTVLKKNSGVSGASEKTEVSPAPGQAAAPATEEKKNWLGF